MPQLREHAYAIMIWLDQGLSAIFLASPDETFSAASYRLAGRGSKKWIFIRDFIDIIFWWDKGPNGEKHCYLSWLKELKRGHYPNEYLKR